MGRRNLIGVIMILLVTSTLATIWAFGARTPSPVIVRPQRTPTPIATIIRASSAPILQALSATEALGYYSYDYERFDKSNSNPTVRLSGDVISNTSGYARGVVDGNALEVALAYDKVLRKGRDGWAVKMGNESLGSATDLLASSVHYPWTGGRGLQPFAAVGAYLRIATDVWQEPTGEVRNGIPVQHFTFQMDPMKLYNVAIGDVYQWPPTGGLPQSIGSGEIWINPVTHYIYELRLTTDPTWLKVLPQATYQPRPSGTPVAHITTRIDVTFARHNDAALTLPAIDHAVFFRLPAPLQRAISTTNALKSYHYSLSITVGGDYATRGQKLIYLMFEGDVVRRGTYVKEVQITGTETITQERLLVDGHYYSKQGSGWIPQSDPGVRGIPTTVVDWLHAANRWELVARLLDHLDATANFHESTSQQGYRRDITVDSLDLVPYIRKGDGRIVPAPDAFGNAPDGRGEVRFDPKTNYIARLSYTVTRSSACNQPDPCGSAPLEVYISLNYERQNDSTLAIPTP